MPRPEFFPSARGGPKPKPKPRRVRFRSRFGPSMTERAYGEKPRRGRKTTARRWPNVDSPAVLVTFPPLSRAGWQKRALSKEKARRARAHLLSGNTRRATHATARQRGPFGNPPRAPLPTPLGARAFRSVRGRGSGTESRRFGVRGREHPAHLHFDMLACFARGSGLDCRGGKRQRIRLRMEGHHSYLANASPGTAKRARGRGGLDGALPECVFLASTAFPRFFPASDSREPPPVPSPHRRRRAGVREARDAEGTPAHEVRASPTRKRSRRAHAPPSVDATVRGMPNAFAFIPFDTFAERHLRVGRRARAEHRARPARRESKRAPLRPSLSRARI